MYNDAAQVIASPMLSREAESNATVQNRLRRYSNGEIVRGDEVAWFDTDHDVALIRAHGIMRMIPQRALGEKRWLTQIIFRHPAIGHADRLYLFPGDRLS